MLSGDNGILKKAGDAKELTGIGQEKEIVTLAYNSALTKKRGAGDWEEVTSEDMNTELANQGATASGSNSIKVTFTVSQRQYTITSSGEITYAGIKNGDEQDTNELPTDLGTKPYFPSDKFKQLEGTDLTTGLVITDKSENEEVGNEYVWIEVPSTAVDSTATGGPDYSGVSGATDYTNITTALINYCTTDASNGNLIASSGSDSNTARGGADVSYLGCGISTSEAYVTLYNKMLKSVYENGGFWIGRYEAGTEIARQNGDSASGITPLSKINLYPINWVTCGEAQTIAGSVPYKGSYNSSLMFGIQWDLVLKYLSNKGVATNLLTGNSETWGNYDFTYTLNQTIAHGYKGIISFSDYTTLTWSAIESGYSHSASDWSIIAPAVLSTGATTRNSQKNIYDLAGNVSEWTLENASAYSDNVPCTFRGGSFGLAGSTSPASSRRSGDTNYSFCDLRFQSITLLKCQKGRRGITEKVSNNLIKI